MNRVTARLRRRTGVLAAVLATALAGVLMPSSSVATPAGSSPVPQTSRAGVAAYVPPLRHVFVVNIENSGYDATWGSASAAPYLARTLRSKGVLLNYYYGTAHNSQPNYVAQISGQGPNPEMQADCQTYSKFVPTGTAPPGQARGSGCVFPQSVDSLPHQMSAHGLIWKAYMDGMQTRCQHPVLGAADNTQKASGHRNYAVRHNPFMYFRWLIGHPAYCQQRVVGMAQLVRDLKAVSTTPNLSYVTPDLCNDGHDALCADGRPGGLVQVDRWMKTWVPKILASPAYRKDGVLIITTDESDSPQSDATACCGEGTSANTPMPGIFGPGGGRVGALVLSRYTRAGTWSTTSYNHYSLLGSIEDIFRLSHLGYAAQPALARFGLDVYNNGWNS